MYENVVAVLISRRPHQRTSHLDRRAEDDFYKRLACPYPRWLDGTIGLSSRPKTEKGGIAAAQDRCHDRFPGLEDQNSDHSCLTAALPRVAGAV